MSFTDCSKLRGSFRHLQWDCCFPTDNKDPFLQLLWGNRLFYSGHGCFRALSHGWLGLHTTQIIILLQWVWPVVSNQLQTGSLSKSMTGWYYLQMFVCNCTWSNYLHLEDGCRPLNAHSLRPRGTLKLMAPWFVDYHACILFHFIYLFIYLLQCELLIFFFVEWESNSGAVVCLICNDLLW